MKALFVAICLLISVRALASEQELLLRADTNGQPHFGIQYVYDVDALWSFTYTTTISYDTLAPLPDVMFWTVLDTNTNQPFAPWVQIDKVNLQVSTLSISAKPVIAKLLPNLKSTKVVFATKDAQGAMNILFAIPIGPLCKDHASHIMDLTNMSKPACTVSASDIPRW